MSGPADHVLEAGRLRVTFYWKGDRFQHRITAGHKTRRSATGGTIRNPTFTEIHRQENLLFLSGNDHACHWSASVHPEDAAVVFDVACRASEDIGSIGSGYEGAGLFVEACRETDGCVLPGPDEVRACPAWSIQPRESWSDFPCTLRYRYRVAAE